MQDDDCDIHMIVKQSSQFVKSIKFIDPYIPALPLSPDIFFSPINISIPIINNNINNDDNTNNDNDTDIWLSKSDFYKCYHSSLSFKDRWENNKHHILSQSSTEKQNSININQRKDNNTILNDNTKKIINNNKDLQIENNIKANNNNKTKEIEKDNTTKDKDISNEIKDNKDEDIDTSDSSSNSLMEESSNDNTKIQTKEQNNNQDNTNTQSSSDGIINYEMLQQIPFVIPSNTIQNNSYSDSEDDNINIIPSNTSLNKNNPPKYSSLTEEEHILYNELKQKLQLERVLQAQNRNVISRLNTGERTLLMKLENTVIKERSEYKEWLIKDFLSRKEDYEIYAPFISEYIESYLEKKRKNVLIYPQYYKNLHEYSINICGERCKVRVDDPILTHLQTIKNIGIVPAWVPSQHYPYKLPPMKEIEKINENDTTKQWKSLENPVVSQDPVINDILQTNKSINIIISSSTLQTIIDTLPPYNKQWEIPIIIKEIASRKVIFLDKPLVKKKMNLREKNTKYTRIAMKYLNLNPQTQGNHIFTNNDNISNENEQQYKKQGRNITYNTWKFGNLEILVRCSIHGVLKDPLNSDLIRYIGLKSKIEYQSQYGLEIISPSETAKWWMYTFLRPDAHLMVGRCNIKTNEIISVDYLTMQHILNPTCGFQPNVSSKLLYVLLQTLINLSIDNYLLSHECNDQYFNILKAVNINDQDEFDDDTLMVIDDEDDDEEDKEESKNSEDIEDIDINLCYDLYKSQEQAGQTDLTNIPYLLTQMPISKNQIPYIFPPKPKKTKKRRKKLPRKPRAKHCFSFAKTGSCSIVNCKFPHLTAVQVEQLSKQLKISGAPRRKRNRK